MNYEMKVLAYLLIYPRRQLIKSIPDYIKSIEYSTIFDNQIKNKLLSFAKKLTLTPLNKLQASYVNTFSLEKNASLNLTRHLYQNDPSASEAFHSLCRLYQQKGQPISESDVPDFLPAILDFLSELNTQEVLQWVKSAKPLIESLNKQLIYSDSPWQTVTEALLSISEASNLRLE